MHLGGTVGAMADDLLAGIAERGYAVVEGVLTPGEIAGVRAVLEPLLADGPFGRNDFEGLRTKRVYALPMKSRVFDRLIEDPLVLRTAGQLLGEGFLLTASLAIDIHPGESAQDLHFDEAFYSSLPRPRAPVSMSTLWALDDFTATNGATVMVPGSHAWGDERPGPDTEVVPLTMPAGAVAVYPGTLWHAGGANTSDTRRLGISLQYVVAWARQQESYLLELPPDKARELSPRMRELVGYSIGPAFMGHVDGRHPAKLIDDRLVRPGSGGAESGRAH